MIIISVMLMNRLPIDEDFGDRSGCGWASKFWDDDGIAYEGEQSFVSCLPILRSFVTHTVSISIIALCTQYHYSCNGLAKL